jgi:hypothetical protein
MALKTKKILAAIWPPLLIFACVIFYQGSQRAYDSNLATHPDEAAHFVSAICVLDYLRHGLGTHPVAFAESFYVRYPRVAFGHWPPLFFIVQALWYGLFGTAISRAILLMGCIVAATAAALFARLRRLYGACIAFAATGVFLWLPVVRNSALLLMSDMLAVLFTLLAVFAFCDALITGRRGHCIRSGIFCLLAVLTKESAISLLFFAPVAFLLLRSANPSSGRQRTIAIAGGLAILIAVTLVSYSLTGVLNLRQPEQTTVSLPELWRRLPLLTSFVTGVSAAMLLTAALGVAGAWRRAKLPADLDRRVHAIAALLFLGATLFSQLAGRDQMDDRYFLPAFLVLTILFAHGLWRLQWMMSQRGVPRPAAYAVLAAWAVVAAAMVPGGNLRGQRSGYAEIADAMPVDPLRPAVLISSDAAGEGGLIAESLVRDRARQGVFLRGGKVLFSANWMGTSVKPLVHSVADVSRLIDAVPVRYIVLDTNGYIGGTDRDTRRLLEETIRSRPGQFRLRGALPLYLDGRRWDGAVELYENVNAMPSARMKIRVDMSYTLGRSLETTIVNTAHETARSQSAADGLASLASIAPDLRPADPLPRIAPVQDAVGPAGDWGRIYVFAPPGLSWHASDMPDWISMEPALTGTGSGNMTLRYEVAENTWNQVRVATLRIGNERFHLRQPAFPRVELPVFETFQPGQSTPPEGYYYLPRPTRWHLRDLPIGRRTVITSAAEGPDGNLSLLLDRKNPPYEWQQATEVYFAGIDLIRGAGYRVSLWLKAEHAAPIWLRLRQRTAPENSCGLDQRVDAGEEWRNVSVWFRASGENCGFARNALFIDAGTVDGKLWISEVSLRRESLQH